MQRVAAFLTLFACAVPACADMADRDPWQSANRAVFRFNETMDRWIAKPVARGYRWATPGFVDRSITSFFNNLDDVANGVDYALQGEGGHAAGSLGRVVTNTLLAGGLIDVAAAGGLPRRDTDFGITLGKWGVGSGPYVMLPALGPSSLRDAPSKVIDLVFNPLPKPDTVVSDESLRFALEGLELVDTRADLLDYEQAVIGDRYSFIRDAWLQARDFDIHGAPAEDPFLDDEGMDEQVDDTVAPAVE